MFLDKDDPAYEIKQEIFLKGRSSDYREFQIGENLKDDDFEEFMSYARFVSFEGDLAELYDRILSKKLKD